MTNKATDTDRGYKRLLADLAAITDPVVLVGIRQDKGAEVPPRVLADGSTKPGSATVAEYAAYNEFGTPTTPSRPFLRRTMDKNRPKYADRLTMIVGDAVDGKRPLEQGMEYLGLEGVRDVKRAITDWKSPPNADSTKRRKKGVNNPLIDTGRLRASIDHEVRMEGMKASGEAP